MHQPVAARASNGPPMAVAKVDLRNTMSCFLSVLNPFNPLAGRGKSEKMFYRLEFDFASDTIMEYKQMLKAEDGHRSRAQNHQPEILNVLDRSRFDLRNAIVRLQFRFGGKESLD